MMPRCFVCDRETVCKSCAKSTDQKEVRGLLEFDRSGASA